MDYDSLLTQYFGRSDALQWYWTLYVVVIGGLLAFSSLRKQADTATTVLLTVLFAIFAWKNLGAIVDVSLQRLALLQAIVQYVPTAEEASRLAALRPGLEPTLAVPDPGGIRSFHLFSDAVTLVTLWAMEWRRRRAVPPTA